MGFSRERKPLIVLAFAVSSTMLVALELRFILVLRNLPSVRVVDIGGSSNDASNGNVIWRNQKQRRLHERVNAGPFLVNKWTSCVVPGRLRLCASEGWGVLSWNSCSDPGEGSNQMPPWGLPSLFSYPPPIFPESSSCLQTVSECYTIEQEQQKWSKG